MSYEADSWVVRGVCIWMQQARRISSWLLGPSVQATKAPSDLPGCGCVPKITRDLLPLLLCAQQQCGVLLCRGILGCPDPPWSPPLTLLSSSLLPGTWSRPSARRCMRPTT
jgi:hypothetical protein